MLGLLLELHCILLYTRTLSPVNIVPPSREFKVYKEWTSAALTKKSCSSSKSRRLYRRCCTQTYSRVRSRSVRVKGSVLVRATLIQERILTLGPTCVTRLMGRLPMQIRSALRKEKRVKRGITQFIWRSKTILGVNLAPLPCVDVKKDSNGSFKTQKGHISNIETEYLTTCYHLESASMLIR